MPKNTHFCLSPDKLSSAVSVPKASCSQHLCFSGTSVMDLWSPTFNKLLNTSHKSAFRTLERKCPTPDAKETQTLPKPSCLIPLSFLGTSAYGKTITNIAKHNSVIHADHKTCQKLINDPHFRKLTPMTADVDEVELSKSKLKWNLPLQIGFFCLPIRQTEDVAVPF